VLSCGSCLPRTGTTAIGKKIKILGVNFGTRCLACSSVVSTDASCPSLRCEDPQQLCAAQHALPVVSLRTTASGTASPCSNVCVDTSQVQSLATITCTTSFQPEVGLVTVTVGGQSSGLVPFDYEQLLPVPVLFAVGAIPDETPSIGGIVTLRGFNLDGGCEVLVSNARGEVVIPALGSTAATLTVCCGLDASALSLSSLPLLLLVVCVDAQCYPCSCPCPCACSSPSQLVKVS
jgi:hypothetical protein